ncbi:hypothetical protein AGMMS49959_11180 [Planctomycetales bacterium]|nr:hypothetical protein AGMMS49959_11180 [Planctomycetales bacterium]
MPVHEKTRRIDATGAGRGVDELRAWFCRNFPDAAIADNDAADDDYVRWETTALAKEIEARKSPGRVLRAYRLREGVSLVELAQKTGLQHTAIAAMERDNQEIDASIARRFAEALHFDSSRLSV